jgi:hypothetical protein
MYADDSTILVSSKDANTLQTDCQLVLHNIADWMNRNKLMVNVDKTKFMVFNKEVKLHLTYKDNPVEQVSQFKLLGCIIDEHLKWRPHIDHFSKKILKFQAMFHHIRHSLTNRAKLLLFNAFIMSTVKCGLIFYKNAFKKHLTILEKAFKKAVKSLFPKESPGSVPHFSKLLTSENNKFILNNIHLLTKKTVPAYSSDVLTELLSKRQLQFGTLLFKIPKRSSNQASFLTSLLTTFNSVKVTERSSINVISRAENPPSCV